MNLPLIVLHIEQYFKVRGMEVNPPKCSLISVARINGIAVPRTQTNIRIDDKPIRLIGECDTTSYLEHAVAAKGYRKPSIVNLAVWCGNLQGAFLKPEQKLVLLRTHLIPRPSNTRFGSPDT